tara:strand:- start:1325 stop:1429 length:105 start_codon:yes stop_codon:yes gene_type:complete
MNNFDIASLINIGLVLFYVLAIIAIMIYAIKFDD